MKLNLKIWRQKNSTAKGSFKEYALDGVNEHMSFLEMLDVLNEDLVHKKEEPVTFEHDCREGICGSCSLVINGRPHGPWKGTTVCQLHMREYKDGDTVVIEPFRARAFPVLKDLSVDRSAFDRIIQSGGYVFLSSVTLPQKHLRRRLALAAVRAWQLARTVRQCCLHRLRCRIWGFYRKANPKHRVAFSQ
jgi:succinate dehydrogenase / fumarate reductase, iron-sulfur subunit